MVFLTQDTHSTAVAKADECWVRVNDGNSGDQCRDIEGSDAFGDTHTPLFCALFCWEFQLEGTMRRLGTLVERVDKELFLAVVLDFLRRDERYHAAIVLWRCAVFVFILIVRDYAVHKIEEKEALLI